MQPKKRIFLLQRGCPSARRIKKFLKNMPRDSKLKFGFPLGALQDEVIELFEAARYKVKIDQEIQKVEIGDPDIVSLLSRPISIASLVEKGILDAGVSTEASLIEAKVKKVKRICNLEYQSLWGKTKVI